MFQKFGKDVPQSLVDAVSNIMNEAKVEPDAPDKEAIERRKRLQALKDRQEDERAAKADRESDPLSSDYKEKKSSGVTVRTHTAKPAVDVNENYDYLEFVDALYEMNEYEVDEIINEVLGKDATAGDYIHDFVHSDNPKFEGKSKEKRKKMALAAYYAKQKNESWEAEPETKKPEAKDDVELKKQSKGNAKVLDNISKEFAKKNEEIEENTWDKAWEITYAKEKGPVGRFLTRTAARMGGTKIDKKTGKVVPYKTTKNEEAELDESRGHKIVAAKLAQIARRGALPQSDKMKDMANLKQVEIVKQKDTSVSHPEDNLGVHDAHYDLNKKYHGYGTVQHEEVEKKDDVPFDGSKPKDNVIVGKKGKGHAKASSLAKMGLKKYLKKETMMGKAGTTSEEVELDEAERGDIKRKLTNRINRINKSLGKIAKQKDQPSNTNPDKDRSIIRRFSKQIPDSQVKPVLGALKKEEYELDEADDKQYTHQVVHIKTGNVIGKYTSLKAARRTADKKDNTYGAVAHVVKPIGEELELDETAVLDKYIRSMGYDPDKMEKNKKVMFSKTNAYKSYATRAEAMYDGGQKGTQDIDDHSSQGATARG